MIVRRDRNITIIDNDVLRDERLSFRARGLFAYLESQPEGYQAAAGDLRGGTETAAQIHAAFIELREHGYITEVVS